MTSSRDATDLLDEPLLNHSSDDRLDDKKELKGINQPSSAIVEIKTSQDLIKASKKAKALRKRLRQVPIRLLNHSSRSVKLAVCFFIFCPLFLGIGGILLGTLGGIDPLLIVFGILFLLGSMGSVYGTYRYSKTFIEIAESGPYSYAAILEDNEREQTELEYKELNLEIKPEYTTKKLCEQLYEAEQQLIEQANRMKIENVFDNIEGSIGTQTAIHFSLFSRGHPARTIILSYLFQNPAQIVLQPELHSHENQSDDEENQRALRNDSSQEISLRI